MESDPVVVAEGRKRAPRQRPIKRGPVRVYLQRGGRYFFAAEVEDRPDEPALRAQWGPGRYKLHAPTERGGCGGLMYVDVAPALVGPADASATVAESVEDRPVGDPVTQPQIAGLSVGEIVKLAPALLRLVAPVIADAVAERLRPMIQTEIAAALRSGGLGVAPAAAPPAAGLGSMRELLETMALLDRWRGGGPAFAEDEDDGDGEDEDDGGLVGQVLRAVLESRGAPRPVTPAPAAAKGAAAPSFDGLSEAEAWAAIKAQLPAGVSVEQVRAWARERGLSDPRDILREGAAMLARGQ